jgi:hypothetical protein
MVPPLISSASPISRMDLPGVMQVQCSLAVKEKLAAAQLFAAVLGAG